MNLQFTMSLFARHKKFLIIITALIVLLILYILIPVLYSGAAPFHMFNLTPKHKHVTEITAIEVAHWEDTIYINDPDMVAELVEKLNHTWYQFWIPTPIRGGTDYMLKIYRDTQHTSYGFGSRRLTDGGIWYFVDMTFLTDLFPSDSIQDGTLYYGGDPVPSDVTELDLSNTFSTDYSLLRDFSDLTMLDLNCSTVTALSPPAGCIEMEELNITHTAISDLSVLSKMPHLKELMASETLMTDISNRSVPEKQVRNRVYDIRGAMYCCIEKQSRMTI